MFDFIGKKKIFFIISLSLMAVCLIVNIVFGTKLSINFKGGTMITYEIPGEVALADVESVAKGAVDANIKVTRSQSLSDDKASGIQLAFAKDITTEDQKAITDALTEKYGEDVELVSFNTVPPTVGKSLFLKGFATVAIACLLMVIYLGFRFRKIGGWSAGLMAIVALIHDVILVYFAFVVFRIPLDDNFIAVILTIIGYSINDTIVIYDRIRENRRNYGATKSIDETVNISLNQVFTRTLNTSITTLIAVLTISIVAVVSGVTSILSFSLPMSIGVIVGCYSSLVISAPLWTVWKNFQNKRKAAKAK
jgi:preprotein translocase subunit SecF